MSAHDIIMRLRKELDMPEEEEDDRELTWKERVMPDIPTFYVTHKDNGETKVSTKVPKWYKKEQKHREEVRNKIQKQERYDLAYWFLETWCAKPFADWICREHPDLDDLVDFCCDYAESWAKFMTHDRREISEEEVLAKMREEDEEEGQVVMNVGGMKFKPLNQVYSYKREFDTEKEFDIPDQYWDEFGEYCKKHPLKHGVKDINKRRAKFLKSLNKRNKKFRKNMLLLDPYTGMSMMSEKKMTKRLHKIVEENKKRTKEFTKYLEGLVEKGYMSEDMMNNFIDRSEDIIDHAKDKLEDAKESRKRWEKYKKEEEQHHKDYEKRRAAWFKKYGNYDDFFEVPPVAFDFD